MFKKCKSVLFSLGERYTFVQDGKKSIHGYNIKKEK